MLTAEQLKNALEQVSQTDGKWTTQWSIVYEQAGSTAWYYFDSNFEKSYSIVVSQ